jgi:hypothetical protein
MSEVSKQTELKSKENNIDLDHANRNCANNSRPDFTTNNNRILLNSSGCSNSSSSGLSGCNIIDIDTTDTGISLINTITIKPGEGMMMTRKSPSVSSSSSSQLVRKSNNNIISSSSKPSFPSLVIALLNTVRSTGGVSGGGFSNTIEGTLHLTQEKVENENGQDDAEEKSDPNSNSNLKLKTRNKNTNGLLPADAAPISSSSNDENGNEPSSSFGKYTLHICIISIHKYILIFTLV